MYLNEPRQMSFTLTNHSKEDYIKFEFPPDHAHLTFSPGSGHLRPCCAKDVVVIFKSATPVEVKMDEVICGVKVIKLLDSRAEQVSLFSAWEFPVCNCCVWNLNILAITFWLSGTQDVAKISKSKIRRNTNHLFIVFYS